MPLTDTKIKNAKAAEKPYTLADGAGLLLDVRPTGAKIFRYRFWLTPKKAGLYTIGEYPGVSLLEARRERERLRELVKQGKNPNQVKRTEKLANTVAQANTFRAIGEEWFRKKEGAWTPYYTGQVRRGLDNDAYPYIGDLPIKDINSLHVLNLLQKIEERGAPTVAINVKQWVSAIFCYAITTLRAEIDPTAALKGAIIRPPINHAKPMNEEGIKVFLGRLRDYGGNRVTVIAMWLMTYLFLRTNELRQTPWVELPREVEDWQIAPDRMKMRRAHIIPLPRQAKVLIEELRTITGSGILVFPNTRQPGKPMSGTTINRALEYMGYPSAEVTGHDFRATASTLLHEMGYEDDWIELQLAHVDNNKTRAAYNHARYLKERRRMLQEWADYIDSLMPPPDAGPG